MNYSLIENPQLIRQKFTDRFLASFSAFQRSHQAWISSLCEDFTESYFERMLMWDRLCDEAEVIHFDEAIRLLKGMCQDVYFLTESPECFVREFCKLSNQMEYVAVVPASDLAECAAYEWYTEFELTDQNCCLADPILPWDLYIFDDTYSWCLILTHETDETESASSRVCLLVNKQ